MSNETKDELLRRLREKHAEGLLLWELDGIVVDHDAKVARCYFRAIPSISGVEGEFPDGLQNVKGALSSTVPFAK